MSAKDDVIARVTIRRAGEMTRHGRKSLAAWLLRHAKALERDGDNYAKLFTGRYYYEVR